MKIQGPITFKKGKPLPDKVKEAFKQSMGLQEISKEEAERRIKDFKKGSKKSKVKKSKKSKKA